MVALDSNVLISLRSEDPEDHSPAATALRLAFDAGPLCICGAVFSELLGLPGTTAHGLRSFLATSHVTIDSRTTEADWQAAGLAYQGYVLRRRASGSSRPRLIATDFIIGAHASVRGYSLLTLDKGIYRAAFPSLQILTY